MSNKLLIMSALSLAIVGCGGGDDDTTTITEPVTPEPQAEWVTLNQEADYVSLELQHPEMVSGIIKPLHLREIVSQLGLIFDITLLKQTLATN